MPRPLLFPTLQGAAGQVEAVGHDSQVVALVGAFVGLMVVAAMVSALAKRMNIPFTVALVVAGALLGALADRIALLAPVGALEVTPEAVFFVFLPTLIFQSAFHLDARALRENLGPTLTLAVPGLLISTALIGVIMHFASPTVGLTITWPEALLLGSILSATDPVAVIGLFSQLGAPKRLTVLVEGESLFNDATAIVLSRIILGIVAAGTFTSGALTTGGLQFLAVFFGGILIGWILALAAGLVIGSVRSDAFIEITVTTVLAYLSFYVAEHHLGLSGVMAVVAAGVVMGGWGKAKISPSVAGYLEHFWDYLAGVANALIFLLVGLTVNVGELVDALPILAWVVAAMLISRAAVIYTLVPVAGRLPGAEPIDRRYQTVMYWGGLRGGIALAIALSLPESLGNKHLFVTLATGAVLFTLLVQGLTIEGVVRHFGLHVPPLSDRVARLEGLIAAKSRTLTEIPMLQAGGLFAPRVAEGVEERARGSITELRAELDRLRSEELDQSEERRLLYLRSFGEETTTYYRMFTRGHLTEKAYRALAHSIELQIESVRHGGRRPEFTVYRPAGARFEAVLHKTLARIPGLAGLAEDLRAARAARDYEIAWARFHGNAGVLEDLSEIGDTLDLQPDIVDELRASYQYWHANARSRLDQIAEAFPEFVSATQDRLGHRLALHAERDAIQEKARAGTIPPGLAETMLDEMARELETLRPSHGAKLAVDPEELLLKVPFFKDLPSSEVQMVVESLRRRTAPIGEAIVTQGERGSSLFLIARGVVRVTRSDDDGERDIATLMAGDFFGEMALLHGGLRMATCRAVSPCALYEMRREDVDSVSGRCASVAEALEEADRVRRAQLEQVATDGVETDSL